MQSNAKIPRGIQSVRAESDPPNVTQMVGALNTAFATFKDKHNTELQDMRRTVDDLATQAAAAQMGGATTGPRTDPSADSLDGGDVRVLRTSSDFHAHYKGVAASKEVDTTPVALSDFLKGVAGLKTTGGAMASLSVGTNSAGGYAVPDILMPRILDALVPASSLLQAGAGVVPLADGAKTVTTAAIDTLPTASWRLEKGTVTESEPTFRAVVAAPKSLACVIKISRELLADGADVDRALRFAIAQAFAKEFDRVGLRGSGTDPEPLGIRDTVGVNKLTLGANGALPTRYQDILRAYQSILTQNGARPTAAIMAPQMLVNYDGLADTTGQPLRKPSLVEPLNFLPTSQIPVNLTTGTSTDTTELYLGDFTGMHFLLRENVSIQLLRESYAGTGEIGFLCHARVDVVVPYPKAFAVITGLKVAA